MNRHFLTNQVWEFENSAMVHVCISSWMKWNCLSRIDSHWMFRRWHISFIENWNSLTAKRDKYHFQKFIYCYKINIVVCLELALALLHFGKQYLYCIIFFTKENIKQWHNAMMLNHAISLVDLWHDLWPLLSPYWTTDIHLIDLIWSIPVICQSLGDDDALWANVFLMFRWIFNKLYNYKFWNKKKNCTFYQSMSLLYFFFIIIVKTQPRLLLILYHILLLTETQPQVCPSGQKCWRCSYSVLRNCSKFIPI